MHYFIFGKEGNMAKLGQYIYLVNNGYDHDKALLSTFGLTPKNYFRKLSVMSQRCTSYSTMKIEAAAINTPYHVRSLKENEARQAIQDLKPNRWFP